MTINALKTSLIIFISTSFFSCTGQVKPEDHKVETKRAIGKVVNELDNQIWKIFQDSKGKYWFGSNGRGIYCLDGKQMKLFTTADNLIDNTIRGIQEDRFGNIYIETPEGISQFDGTKFTTLKVVQSPDNEWKLNPNDLWFGCNANDVYRFDGASLHELKLPRKDLKAAFGVETEGVPFKGNNNSPYAVFGVNKDKDGHIWFGTATAGAFRFDGKTILWLGEKELSTLPDGRVPGVRAIIQDNEGCFWASNFLSKYKIDPKQPKGYEKMKAVYLSQVSKNDKLLYFNAGIADDKGNLWMTTYGNGVWKYDGKTLSKFEVFNGKENVLLVSIFQDKNGILWLGTDNDGVYKSNGESFEKFEINQQD